MVKPPRIAVALLNDTASYPHVGCQAVCDAHSTLLGAAGGTVLFRHYVGELHELWDGDRRSSRRRILSSPIARELSLVDAAVVNGEGTIHHGHGLHLLAILAYAQELGKRTYLVNCVLQDVPHFDDVLGGLSDLAVRDVRSLTYLRSKGIPCRLVADSVLAARFHDGHDPDFDDKVVVTDCVVGQDRANAQLQAVLRHYGERAAYYPLEGENAMRWRDALRAFRAARFVVTGRHHGVYLALMAGKPFLALPSNSWKIEGTLEALGLNDRGFLCGPEDDVLALCESIPERLDRFAMAFDHPFLRLPLGTFDKLVADFAEGASNELDDSQTNEGSRTTYSPHGRSSDMGEVMKPVVTSGVLEAIAEQVIQTCGGGRILDFGSGDGALVSALLKRGADAYGAHPSNMVVSSCLQLLPGRFSHASALSLPFEDGSFPTVVSVGCLEGLPTEDVPRALREINRVTSRFLFLGVSAGSFAQSQPFQPARQRAWWETRCFEAGFRKHPAYYRINDYESLNHDSSVTYILLEKLPAEALDKDPLDSLAAERGLHMDMLRESGERSDAHVVRYQWACGFIKPGDRVLDATCGLGYGGHVIGALTGAASVLGIDGSQYAIDYATRSFGRRETRRYEKGFLPQALSSYEDGSFEVIVSFATLERVEDPAALLREFHRLLAPGGRVIVSVPNDWSDATGKDPNPYHLHVYDWARLKRELGARFILENAMAQTASRCKVPGPRKAWVRMPRSLQQVELSDNAPADCEWWLMSAMKSPLAAGHEYRERAFHNIAASGHPSIDYAGTYRNPWLMHAMVNVTYRLRNGAELERLASGVMDSSPIDSNDHAAALCVKAYRVLDRGCPDVPEALGVISRIDAVVASPPDGAMGLRWKVSLLYVRARLLQAMGRLEEAREFFEECGRQDVRGFGIHLSSKPTEAWFHAGKIAHALGDLAGARSCWEHGVEYGNVLLTASLYDILINPSFPNRFNYGDGVREYTVSWDNIARCANGLHLLSRGGPLDDFALENCFQTEYSAVVGALLETRLHLAERTQDLVAGRRILVERTGHLGRASDDLLGRTKDLVGIRAILVERTEQLEQASEDLRSRTQELVETRAALVERTEQLERASEDLRSRTQELVETRASLVERSQLLEAVDGIPNAARELVEVQQILTERTERLEVASRDLVDRTRELVETRETLAERTRQLETASRDLHQRAEELAERREALAERTGQFETASYDLYHRTRELGEIREALAERTRQLETASHDLRQRTLELVETRETLVERTERLESAHRDLDEKTRTLKGLAAKLENIQNSPFAHALRETFRKFFK